MRLLVQHSSVKGSQHHEAVRAYDRLLQQEYDLTRCDDKYIDKCLVQILDALKSHTVTYCASFHTCRLQI